MVRVWLRDARRWRALMLASLLLGAGWIWAARIPGTRADAGRPPSPREGFPAPDFALEAMNGETVKLANYRGQKTVLLVFYRGYF